MVAPKNELIIERDVMRCPACNEQIKATLTFKVTATELPRAVDSEGNPDTAMNFHQVSLKQRLESMELSHSCKPKPGQAIRQGASALDLGTPIGGRPIRDNPQA